MVMPRKTYPLTLATVGNGISLFDSSRLSMDFDKTERMASSGNNQREINGHVDPRGKKNAKKSSPRPTSISSGKSSNTPVHRHNDSISMIPSSPAIKPQSWSETHMETSANRMRIKEKFRPVSAAVASKLRQQREKRRTKRREPSTQSTEGTSTGDEDGELFQMDNVQAINLENKSKHRYSLYHQGDNGKQPPPSSSSRRFSSPMVRRMSKSPSDLDADDEDNQDYDSASLISASEILQARVRAIENSTIGDDPTFNAQFQEIRMAGMQQLADIDRFTGSNGGSLMDCAEDQVGKILEKERREKSALIQELGQKEQRIYEMEKTVLELNRRLLDSGLENEHLKAENRALLQAMANLSAGD